MSNTIANCILAGLQIAYIVVAATIFFDTNYVPFDIIPVGMAVIGQGILFGLQVIYNKLDSVDNNIRHLR